MQLLRILLCIAAAASLQAAVPILDPKITGTAAQVTSGTFTVKSGATLATESGTIFSFAEKLNLASGGTGVSLSDPGADRVMFWDDSAGSITWLTFGTGLSISGTTATVDSTLFAPANATFLTSTASSGLSAEFALGTLATGLLKNTTTTGIPTIAAAGTDYVAPGAATSSGLTMATARILGRTEPSSGAIEEITVGSGLTMSAGTLSASATAPTDATYITQTPSASLSAEQALSALATGLMQVTTTTGVISSVTTSAGISALLSDETGSGAAVFGTSPAFTDYVTLANGTSPTTSAVARMAFDTNAWATDRGTIQVHDGTASAWVVAVQASDTPSDGQFPRWNTGGTITWETVSGGSGDVATDAIWDAKGDLAVGTGANTGAKLSATTNGHILTLDSGEPTGMKWAAPSGGGGGGTLTLARFTALDNQPPSSAFATFGTRNSIAVLAFDAGTDESAVFAKIIPEAADFTTGISVRIHWIAASATSGDAVWVAAFERSNTDLDSDSFATGVSGTSTTNGTSGIITVTTINFSGSEIDGVTAGDTFRLKLTRDADAGGDTMTGDAQLVSIEMRQR